MISPLDFIERLREIYPDRYVEPNGCLKFHVLLKALYPQSRGWHDSEHIITEIDGEFYDIDGLARRTAMFIPVEQYGPEYFVKSWATKRRFEVC